MASKVEICNIGLAQLRANSIVSLNENSGEAENCLLFYDICREFVLEDANWQFAKNNVSLTLINSAPSGWAYAYNYPENCLKVRHVTNKDIEYEVMRHGEVKVIATNQPSAVACYTENIKEVSEFSASFNLALGYYIGSQIARPLVGGNEGKQMQIDCLQLYGAALGAARVNDFAQQKKIKPYSKIFDEYE